MHGLTSSHIGCEEVNLYISNRERISVFRISRVHFGVFGTTVISNISGTVENENKQNKAAITMKRGSCILRDEII